MAGAGDGERPADGAVERLGEGDLADCLALSASAGWNQVAADWRLFFRLGAAWGVREAGGGTVLASAALMPYPPDAAWIAMVLTLPRARGRGLARRLVARAVAEAERRGLVPTLDATPAGEPVYRHLGFCDGPHLARWRRRGAPPAGPAAAGLAAATTDRALMHDLSAREAAASGLFRPHVLENLLSRGPAALGPEAMALCRDGRTAWHVGPVEAEGASPAASVLGQAIGLLPAGDAVVVDLVDGHALAERALRQAGFAPERPFRRMSRGRAPATDLARYVAAIGPEFG